MTDLTYLIVRICWCYTLIKATIHNETIVEGYKKYNASFACYPI